MTATRTRLVKAVRNYHNATNPTQRDAARRFVGRRAQELQGERDALRTRLEQGWTWLERNAGHPDAAETEAMWLADLEEYERCEDALANAMAVFTGSEVVQERKAA